MVVPMTDMRMRPDRSTCYLGRTYRFYEEKKVFKFGYGLSYTTHFYQFILVAPNHLHFYELPTTQTVNTPGSARYLSVLDMGTDICKHAEFSGVVRVQNHGQMESKHPVLLFASQARASCGSPVKQFVGFQSVRLEDGEGKDIELVINPCEHLSRSNEDGLVVIGEGTHYLLVGKENYFVNVGA